MAGERRSGRLAVGLLNAPLHALRRSRAGMRTRACEDQLGWRTRQRLVEVHPVDLLGPLFEPAIERVPFNEFRVIECSGAGRLRPGALNYTNVNKCVR
jgi:hypothetical protein